MLVENFRPDVKHRLRIDYETLSQVNPRLVYGSISGFGQSRPVPRPPRPGPDRPGPVRTDDRQRRAGPWPDARRAAGGRSDGRLHAGPRHPDGAARTRALGSRAVGPYLAAAGQHPADGVSGCSLPDDRRGARPGRQLPPDLGADRRVPGARRQPDHPGWRAEHVQPTVPCHRRTGDARGPAFSRRKVTAGAPARADGRDRKAATGARRDRVDRAADRGWRTGRDGAERRAVLRERAGQDAANRCDGRAPGAGTGASAGFGRQPGAHAGGDQLSGARAGSAH